MSTDAYTHKSADNFRFEASKLMLAPDDDTYNLIHIPRFAFISDVWLQIVTAFTVNASITIGWAGNSETALTNGFMTEEIADPTHTGFKRAFNTALTTFPGKWFADASGVVTATVLDVDGAVGDFRVFVQFTVIHS